MRRFVYKEKLADLASVTSRWKFAILKRSLHGVGAEIFRQLHLGGSKTPLDMY